jgi:hypothetical protein
MNVSDALNQSEKRVRLLDGNEPIEYAKDGAYRWFVKDLQSFGDHRFQNVLERSKKVI